MRTLIWLLRALIFFVIFAFALNNQHEATLKWFFGAKWQAPMVYIVLGAFSLGCALGIIAMLPRLWRNKRATRRPETATVTPAQEPSQMVGSSVLSQPARESV